ncbi:hypothetical protein CVT24_012881 [Panaeolus cyanescens]|uniref:ATP-dependent DNA helicase n=1 Tax=Panaeolus cyanescens TaxID=181874 RepID=A0A409W2Y3_9AGAR|nr:hypothetical protein CVT24_012881 [Panaeolus cyanescens]
MATSVPIIANSAIKRAENADPNQGRCLVENSSSAGAMVAGHVFNRDFASAKPSIIDSLEWSWKMKRGTLNLDTRRNIIFRPVSPSLNTLFQDNKWGLLPVEKDVYYFYDEWRVIPHRRDTFVDLEEETYTYTLLPLRDMEDVYIPRQASDGSVKIHEYPYEDFPVITSHIHPRFAILHLGAAVSCHRLQQKARRDLFENIPYMRDIQVLYRAWSTLCIVQFGGLSDPTYVLQEPYHESDRSDSDSTADESQNSLCTPLCRHVPMAKRLYYRPSPSNSPSSSSGESEEEEEEVDGGGAQPSGGAAALAANYSQPRQSLGLWAHSSPQQTRNLRPPLPTPSDENARTEVELHRSSVRRSSRQTHLQEPTSPRRRETTVQDGCNYNLPFRPEPLQQTRVPLQNVDSNLSPSYSQYNNLSTGLLSPPSTQRPTTTESCTIPIPESNVRFVNLTPETVFQSQRQRTQQSQQVNGPSFTSTPTPTPPINRRSEAQRRRREREREQRLEQLQQQLQQSEEAPSVAATSTSNLASNNPSNRSRAQQGRRRREQIRQIERMQEQRVIRFADNEEVTYNLNTPQTDNRSTVAETEGAGDDSEREETEFNDIPPLNSVDITVTPPARLPYREPSARHSLGRMNHICQHCGAKHWLAEKLVRSSQASPTFVACCDHGTVNLPRLQAPPDLLRHLFINNDDQSKNFRDNISEYNQALAFTSLGVTQDHTINAGRGQPVFRIQGELHHHTGSLLPPQGRAPVYAQLYFYDPRSAVDLRMANNQHRQLRRDTMESLQQIIYENHQYAPLYLHAHEILRQYNSEDVSIRLRVSPGTVRGPATTVQQADPTYVHDPRLYRPPTADEVALIYPEDPSAEWRDIILRRRSGRLERISECHPAYSPLQYVLLFPYGETGWFPELEIQNTRNRSKRTKVTLLRYTAFRLHDRSEEFSCLLRGGRLLQRYITDMWAAADQKNLRYLRQNQHLFRCHISSGLTDAFNDADGEVDLNELGQRVILPSSYTGGPRQMHERFQDSMAIARHFKKVDLFITMTCNPQWQEIQDELKEYETPYDRPDLVSRVFQLKKEALLQDIIKHGVLGRVVAYVYTIEFQKRGLPHMHLLIFFDAAHKLFTPEDIDKLIWARWPDKDQHPLLFETVKSCMVHGPCGAANPNAICMDPEKKICTKRFPKDFCEATNMDGSGYPEYYRPNDGIAVQIRNGFHADNRWIVPYCPYLSAKYNCHLNVECAISLNSLKYVFKYIQKGSDRTIMELHRRDEIKRWLDARYISASEASWRIFEFDLHKLSPTITRLAVHLPGQYMVSFNPNEDPEEVRQRALTESSTLTAFFAANRDSGQIGQIARQLTYQDFPQRFVWVKNKDKNGRKNYWKLRVQGGLALGRMYFVPPTGGERFYLRTLLTAVKGPTSFRDLRTYNGRVFNTFEEACLARGLLEDDGEWDQCLQEAALMQTGSSLRQLFTTLLLFCDVLRADRLWERYRPHICDDLRFQLERMGLTNISEDQVYDYGLFLINKLLQAAGKTLADYRLMPQPQHDWTTSLINPLVAEYLNYQHDEQRALFEQRISSFNNDQLAAYHAVIDSVESHKGDLFFLNGPGGTGKTYVYNTICNKLRSEGHIVIPVASSGIASLLITGGRTAHSTFKIPVTNLHHESTCSIRKDSDRADLLRKTSLIIWDEAATQHRHAVEAVDRTLRDICGIDKPFGGITVLFGGDFQQTLPVVRGNAADIIDATLLQSTLWRNMQVLHLRQNMRLGQTEADQHYSSWLLDIGHGRHLAADGTLKIPRQLLCATKDDLIYFIYPDIQFHSQCPLRAREYFKDRMVLAPRNIDVAQLNEDVLALIDSPSRTYISADTVVDENGTRNANRNRRRHDAAVDWTSDEADQPIPPEVLRAIDDSSLPPGELTIKVGSPLILLRNLSPANGLCNGTRCIVTKMEDRVIEVQIMGGDFDGSIALIPRITLFPSDTSTFTYNFRRRQFPVRLAFALSINKAQGQSVKYVGLQLQNGVFSHGQLYVAFSRATAAARVRVLLPNGMDSTKNIVYPEVLLD